MQDTQLIMAFQDSWNRNLSLIFLFWSSKSLNFDLVPGKRKFLLENVDDVNIPLYCSVQML